MISVTTEKFRKCYRTLPPTVKESARKAYSLWKEDPKHKSLQYKVIHKTKSVYSVRITLAWRALGVRNKNTMIWFWIGSHADYDKLIDQL